MDVVCNNTLVDCGVSVGTKRKEEKIYPTLFKDQKPEPAMLDKMDLHFPVVHSETHDSSN